MNVTSSANSSSPQHPLYLFLTGLCMGAADVVPGVSGGTMAFILGIYTQLLDAIKSFNGKLLGDLLRGRFRKAYAQVPIRFLFPLGLGVVTAILSLAELITYLLATQESLLFAFFFGLVSGSIVILAARHQWNARGVAALFVGTLVAYWIVGLVPAQPGHTPLILFLSGAIAICAMILPGISGSFILLILGQYAYCVNALHLMTDALRQGDFPALTQVVFGTVLPVAMGAAVGLIAFARVLSWLLNRHGTVTVAALIGFMVGSLRRIWPFKEVLEFGTDRHGDPIALRWRNVIPTEALDQAMIALALAVGGFALICLLDHLYDRRNPVIVWFVRWLDSGKARIT
jgi:putative membrane protein